MAPAHSTIAAFVSSITAEMVSLVRDSLLVCEAQGLLGGTHFALDGLTLSSNAAKEWRGTCADVRQKKETLAEQVKKLLAEHQQADHEGEVSRAGAHRSEQAKAQEPMARLAKPAARMAAFLAKHAPQRGKRGKALHRNVTDTDSAKMQTAHGVLQGYKGQALVDAKYQVIVHAEASGNGQDSGHVAPLREGAKANVQASGVPGNYFAGQVLSADSKYHSAANLKTGAQEKREAYIPDTHVRQRAPRLATQERHKPSTHEKFTVKDFPSDPEHECYGCPNGKC
jgi:hypothetical protein